jgi:outer membrane receptor protein involved in Fe transport
VAEWNKTNLKSTRGRLLASTILVGAASLMVVSAASAQSSAPIAQTAQAQPMSAPSGAAALPTDQSAPPAAVQEVVVTGSRLVSPNLTSTSPVTTVNSEEVKLTGTTRVEDLINQLPQAFAAQGSAITNGASGTATVDLRGLGSNRTLVLIDGKRLQPGDPSDPAPDLNFIPAGLIDRVEVLTGGASATYGSDAVAGVVNFIMKKDFQGLEINAQQSIYQHDNSNSALEADNTADGFASPHGSTADGGAQDVSIIFGANAPDGKGNVTLYGTYRQEAAVLQGQRDYSACTLHDETNGFACAGSGTTYPAQLLSNDLYNANLPYDYQVRPGGGLSQTIVPFNYGPYNYYQRPDTRYTLGGFAHYDINPKVDLYGSFMFMDDHTVAQIAPGGVFGNTVNIPCNNPELSAVEVQTLCTNAGLTAADSASVAVVRRDVEGSGRVSDLRHEAYRMVIGAKGDLDPVWHYDISAQYGETVFQEIDSGYFSGSKIANAFNVVPNPTTGAAECASVLSGTDTSCVPYNIFGTGPVTPAALAYLEANGFINGSTTEQDVQASMSGQLGKYGVRSPFAKDGIGVAVGTEYRRENLVFSPDAEESSGDLSGGAGPQPSTSGTFDVYELFGEVEVPIVQDAPFVKLLSFNGGYRFSDYSTAGVTNTFKLAGTYSPIDSVTFRGGFNRAVRAPNVLELYTSDHQDVGDFATDPCAGANPAAANPLATLANCEKTGATASNYGRILPNTAGQYNGLVGGNPNLQPETSDTITAGIVFAPKEGILKGFNVSADYFNILIKGEIAGIGGQTILTDCLTSGEFCNLIHRDPNNGSLWINTNDYVEDTDQNVGGARTSGVDIQGGYRLPFSRLGLQGFGALTFEYDATWLSTLETQSLPGTQAYDCAGLYGPICGTPNPKFRHKFRTTWSTPIDGLEVSGQWRYFSAVKVDTTEPYVDTGTVYAADAKIPSQSYMDMTLSYRFRDHYRFIIGCQNVLDTPPPIIGDPSGGSSASYNGNTYPQVYDALGRYIFSAISIDY